MNTSAFIGNIFSRAQNTTTNGRLTIQRRVHAAPEVHLKENSIIVKTVIPKKRKKKKEKEDNEENQVPWSIDRARPQVSRSFFTKLTAVEKRRKRKNAGRIADNPNRLRRSLSAGFRFKIQAE